MSKSKLVWVACVALCLVLSSAACKPKPPKTTPAPPPAPSTETKPAAPPPAKTDVQEGFPQQEPERAPIAEDAAALNAQGVLKTIYFDYDKSELSETARATLRANAEWLKANPKWNAVIEGHCDERGTIEYNLALGQRRANSVREYMGSLGVAVANLRVVSYGEERPVDPGHTEASWAKNRRAESKVEAR